MIGRWMRKWTSSALGRLVPPFFVCILLFLFAMVHGGFLSWFLFYLFVPIALYIVLLMLYPFHSIAIERYIEDAHWFSGDTLHTKVVLKRRWALPFFLVTICERPDHLFPLHDIKPAGLMLWVRREAVFNLAIPNMPRGKYTLGEIELKTGDPFGFFERTVYLQHRTIVYIFPKVRSLSMSDLALTQTGLHQSVQEADLSNFSGVRAYRPNDRPSWLDWKSSARTNVLVTKQFEPEREKYASVVLVSRDEDSDELFEWAVSFTASLLKALLSNGFSVFLTYNSEEKPLFIPEDAPRALSNAYRVLAELRKDQVLATDDVRMSRSKKYMGYAVSTDPRLAYQMSEFAKTSRQRQKMFFLDSGETIGDFRKLANSWFSLSMIKDELFRSDSGVGE